MLGRGGGKFVFVSMCGAIGISYNKWPLQISTFYLSTKDYKVLGTTSGHRPFKCNDIRVLSQSAVTILTLKKTSQHLFSFVPKI